MSTVRRDVDWDDPQTTIDSKELIQQKPLLKYFYEACYRFFQSELDDRTGENTLELGSGAGFIKNYLPQCITSDVLDLPFIDEAIDARNLPFESGELSAICMIDVFHHIPDVNQFLVEAERVLKPGGKIIMVEPANTRWGRFIYQNFHHEPFDPDMKDWTLPDGGPMSAANGALPWIVFKRDLQEMSQLCPQLNLTSFETCFPLLYLISGGLSYPQLVPTSVAKFIDKICPSGMFYKIVISKW